MRTWLVVLVIVMARVAIADPERPDDAMIYSCRHVPDQVLITFKPEIEVKDLITWAMGFTCNRYLYDNRYVANRHVTVIAPEKMSAHDAYDLFLASLATAGLAGAWRAVPPVPVRQTTAPTGSTPYPTIQAQTDFLGIVRSPNTAASGWRCGGPRTLRRARSAADQRGRRHDRVGALQLRPLELTIGLARLGVRRFELRERLPPRFALFFE